MSPLTAPVVLSFENCSELVVSDAQEVASKECWERAKREVEEAEKYARAAEVKAREAIRLAEEAARTEEAAEAAAKEEAR